MPTYNENDGELIFRAEESAESCCPICGSGLEYGSSETHGDMMVYPWDCRKCGAEGKEYGAIVFDGHNVDFTTLSVDKQLEFTEAQTLCINGPLHVGDLVLSTIDDSGIPCLPGIVKEINPLGTAGHETDNDTDDVHVDFTGDYSERRKQEIVEAYTALYGYERPYEEIGHDYLIMDPDCLINITGIEDEKLHWIMESEENAVRYAYTVLRAMAKP